MTSDARISTSLPSHPKTKKLIRRLGPCAGWSLVCLFLWAAQNRSDGNLIGLTDEDVELSADWFGEDGALVAALVEVRFLDGEEGAYRIHNWAEHNPWAAGAERRSAKARWNAAKRHHGAAEADRLVPEYAAIRNASSNASSTASLPSSNAPSPSPSPSPSKEQKQVRKRTKPATSPLPDGFTVSDRVFTWASRKGYGSLDQHLEFFVSKAKAKGYVYADWDEAFMGAIRDDWAGLRNAPARGSPNGQTTLGKQAQGLMALEAMKSGNRMAAGRDTGGASEALLLGVGSDASGRDPPGYG